MAEAQNDPSQQPAPLPDPKPKWLWGLVGTDLSRFVAFPVLPAGLIAVTAISHAGYLTDKAFLHSVSE